MKDKQEWVASNIMTTCDAHLSIAIHRFKFGFYAIQPERIEHQIFKRSPNISTTTTMVHFVYVWGPHALPKMTNKTTLKRNILRWYPVEDSIAFHTTSLIKMIESKDQRLIWSSIRHMLINKTTRHKHMPCVSMRSMYPISKHPNKIDQVFTIQ